MPTCPLIWLRSVCPPIGRPGFIISNKRTFAFKRGAGGRWIVFWLLVYFKVAKQIIMDEIQDLKVSNMGKNHKLIDPSEE